MNTPIKCLFAMVLLCSLLCIGCDPLVELPVIPRPFKPRIVDVTNEQGEPLKGIQVKYFCETTKSLHILGVPCIDFISQDKSYIEAVTDSLGRARIFSRFEWYRLYERTMREILLVNIIPPIDMNGVPRSYSPQYTRADTNYQETVICLGGYVDTSAVSNEPGWSYYEKTPGDTFMEKVVLKKAKNTSLQKQRLPKSD